MSVATLEAHVIPIRISNPSIIAGPAEIRAVIPHGTPAILIDGITDFSLDDGTAAGYRTIRYEDCAGHFDSEKELPRVVPGAILEEMGYQVGLYVLCQLFPDHIAAPEQVTKKHSNFAIEQETIEFRCRLIKAPDKDSRLGEAEITCSSQLDGRLVLNYTFTFTVMSYKLFARLVGMVQAKLLKAA